MSNEIEITISNNWSATLDLATGVVNIFDDDCWATEGRWNDGIDDAAGDIDEDIYDELDEALKTALDEFRDLSPVITGFFREWGNTGPKGAQSAAAGFVNWCYDVRQETRTQLADGELDDLAREVAYTVEQAHRIGSAVTTVSENDAREWLLDNREELLEAIDEELAFDCREVSKLRLYQDGEPVDTCTIEEFAEANRDSPDLVSDVRALKIGESTAAGGGAAPAFRIERLR